MMAPQKRPAEEAESLLVGVRSLLLDIEGTTTPISFVEKTLFPYVTNNIESYLNKNFENADVQKAIAALRDQAAKEKDEKVEGVVEIPSGDASKEDVIKAVIDNVKWQMGENRKTTELKALQGLIWKEAFESSEIKGELFEDVGPMLKMLAEEGFKLYVFSSASIQSQKLLFSYSNQGDLSDVFSGYFDTTTGSKRDKASYKKIATEIGHEPKDILFLTDIPEEAEAAVGAGLRSALVIRPGNEELTDENLQNFACIERFDELYGDEDEEDDIKRFAGGNGEADDDDEEEEEGDEDEEEEEEGDDA
ncbi:enolase-phosphatase E1 [Biomphalaria glabrata]|uniref:Enolase-phosphatase E1-like n=1 Tax=Biomphalaria glabrata TaxID=6526 RepID=A0A9W2ZVV1_BIOGL|nr:enolase-phosphatase E1-like [Biomphalaria glabrata]KAI8740529.1 enolase-phosphatase E1 [Biomphalaria glabrata]